MPALFPDIYGALDLVSRQLLPVWWPHAGGDPPPPPRDWDIRVRMSREAFAARYGSGDVSARAVCERWLRQGETGNWKAERWAWSDERVKLSHRWAKKLGLNVDLQIYPPNFWRTFNGEQRVRLA